MKRIFAFLLVILFATLLAPAPASAQDKATQSLTLTVNSGALVFTTTSLPHATVGVPYSQAVVVTGGVSPYAFSVSVGVLPAGLSLSAAGVVSGTPTVTGTVSFTIRATDSEVPAASASQAFSVIVINALVITTTTLPAANAGQPYSASINFTGGLAPYTCSIISGALPTGLALGSAGASSCPISGTPTAAGSFTFTIQVADSVPAGQSPIPANRAILRGNAVITP